MADALLLVRNAVTNDARVLRQARALQGDGWDVLVLGVQTAKDRRATSVEQGVTVRRIAPRSPAQVLRGLLRRGAPTPASAPAAPAPPASAPAGGAERRSSPPPGGKDRRSLRAGATGRLNRLLTTGDFHRLTMAQVLRERPRLVVANDYNTLWSGVLGARLVGARVVYDSHELWADRNGRSEWRAWLIGCEALFVRLVDAVLAASPGYADALAERYRITRPTVVRNIPDALPRDAAPPDPGPPRLVYVGGLLRGRGIEELLAALALVPDAVLDLYGPTAPGFDVALRAEAEARGVADRVRFCGVVPPQDVPRAAAGAHLGLSLIQPVCRSYELTLPNKVFEYVAAGVPVLVSDLPVMREVVEREGIGVIAPPGDVERVAAAIREAVEPERQRELRARVAEYGRRATWANEREVLLGAVRAAVKA